MFTKEVKGKVGIVFVTKYILESDHCYLGLRPTVDTALILLLSHPVLRINRMHSYMYAKIKFHTYRDIKSE